MAQARPISMDHERFSVNLAKIKKGGENFEIVVDPDKAIEFREGKSVDINDVLINKKIFSDSKKGMHASEEKMKEFFGTSDVNQVAEVILRKGEVHLTAEHKRKLLEEKRKRIVAMIHRNGVDPKTHLPHPPQRIENAMAEVKAKIDEFKSADAQLQDVIKQIRTVLPIKFEMKEIAVRIPAEYAAKLYSTVKNFGQILNEDWQKDGSWVCVVEIPAGLQNDLIDQLNAKTKGNIEMKILKVK